MKGFQLVGKEVYFYDQQDYKKAGDYIIEAYLDYCDSYRLKCVYGGGYEIAKFNEITINKHK